MNRKLAIICIIGFSAMFILAFVGSWAIADAGDRLMRESEKHAKKYMGWHEGQRVYFNEKEKKLEYQD